MKTKYLLFIAALLMFFSLKSYSSHIRGGEINYEYAGYNATTGLYSYRITLYVYTDCGSTATAYLDSAMNLGVYQHDPSNPNAAKVRYASLRIHILDSMYITPQNPNPGCSGGPNVCVNRGLYQTIINLAPSVGGYHLIVERCCRNAAIANIANPGASGEAFYAFIPPTNIQNHSPTFASAPVPYICTADTASDLNLAFDSDGDSLAYSFQVPYKGTSGTGNPQPTPPTIYTWPIATVSYATNYSLTNPFGPGGYAYIDPATGLTKYYIPNSGNYVVAVEIKEYRHDTLIGITRRDLQLIVAPCSPNSSPAVQASNPVTYTVDAGSNLCFPVTFSDADGDSIYISSTGTIFDGSVYSPPATMPAVKNAGTATAQFCWQVPCVRGGQSTYQFVATAIDNGCPSKTTNVVYTINVNPQEISAISGADSSCLNQPGTSYSVNSPTGTSYQWNIIGGSQSSGGTTNAITVDWTTPSGEVSVYAIDANGCHSDTSTKTVTNLRAIANAGVDANVCSEEPVTLGGPPASDYSYLWTPGTNLSDSTISNPSAAITNAGSFTIVAIYTLTATYHGCTATDAVNVTVYPFPTVSLLPFNNVCADATPFALTGGSPAGGQYSGPGIPTGTNMFNPQQAGIGIHTITYTYSTAANCTSEATTTINVVALPTVTYIPPTTQFCVDALPVALTGGNPTGGSYSGTGVSSGSFDPLAAQPGTHVITYQYTDANSCTSSSTSTFTVYALPTVTYHQTPNQICADASPITLSSGTPAGGNYHGLGVINGNMFDPLQAGIGLHDILYSYSDTHGCSASSTSSITVNAAPTVTLSLTVNQACANASPVTLSGGSPIGGTYSGGSAVVNGILDPALAGIGVHTITYSFADPVTGCSASSTSTFTVNALPTVTLTLGTACVGSTPFALTGGAPAGGTYGGQFVTNGMFDPAAAGIGPHSITYSYTDPATSCSATATGTIIVGTLPSPTVTVSPALGCQSNTIYIGYGQQFLTLTATNSGGGVVTYQWYKNGVLIPGATSSTLQVTTAGAYTVVATDASGCTSSPTSPTAIATISSVDVRCGNNMNKVVLCHVPPGNPGNPQTLCIAPSAIPAHLSNHPGDCLGPCTFRLSQLQNGISENEFSTNPNPFSGETMIHFAVVEPCNAVVGLYNIEGKLVRTLFNGIAEEGKTYDLKCSGEGLPSGVYIIKLIAGDYANFERLIKF